MDTSPEPEAQPKPMMTDEGCQTVGLEDHAAEVLAELHRQAMNVGSSLYSEANGAMVLDAQAQPLGEAELELHGKPADTPLIQTQQDADLAKLPEQESHHEPASQKIPSSPRLQPGPSSALPLISPLITNRLGAFLGMGPIQGIIAQVPSLGEQIPPPSALPAVGDEHEDLYGASPAAIHGQAHMNELNGFQDPPVDFNASDEASNMHGQSLAEGQHGHWQSGTAQLSRGGSPHKVVEEVEEEKQQDGFHEERQEGFNFPNNGFPTSGADEQHLQQYPGSNEENYGQPIGAWESGSAATAYPDLPEHDEELSNSHDMQQALHPRAVAMSRSGSAQPIAIDLIESSSEEEDDEGDITVEGPIDEEHYERSNIYEGGSMDKESEPIHHRTDGYRSLGEESDENEESDSMNDEPIHNHSREDPQVDDEDGSQNFQDEEEPYEEELYEEEFEDDGQYEGYRPAFDQEQEEDFDEEEDEGSYDEDMEEDGQPQRTPVVIDLLSSDDEDDGEAAALKPESELTTPSRHPAEVEFPHSSEDRRIESDDEMDAEEDMDAEQNLSHEPWTHPSAQRGSQQFEDENEDERSPVEEDDNIINTEQDDDLPDTGDEDGVEAVGSDNGAHANGLLEFGQDTEMVQSDEALEDEESTGASDKNEQAIEQVTPEKLQDEFLPGRHALQEVEANREISMSEEKEESGPSTVDKASVQPSDVPAPPPSLFARMFNLDGANDEHLPSLYPILPKEKDVNSPIKASPLEETPQNTIPVEDQPMRQTNCQLPTPNATQLSLVKESSEVSISSVDGPTLPSEPLQSASDEATIDLALEDAQHPMEEGNITSVDDNVANVESGTTGTKAIDDRAKISLEGNNTEKAKDQKALQVVIEAHNTRSRTRQQNGSVEPVIHEEAQSLEEALRVSPRRSHRRGKSTSSTTDPPQSRRLTTPSKSKADQDESVSARTDRSSSIILDERSTPKGHDASIELAMSALDSPVKQQHDLRSKLGMDVKLKLTRALRTELGEFTALKVLRFHLTQKLDVLGVVTTVPPEPERAKAGPRHYQITFNITDQSIAPGGSPPVTEVQIFRPYKDALPIVKVGDGILLRNFLVVSVKNRGFALQSSEASSWAVFKGEEEEQIDVRGPPVEYGAGEKKQIAMLRSWYTDLDSKAMEKIDKANGDKGTAGAGKGIGKVF